jgi:putative ABC transport system permease protein
MLVPVAVECRNPGGAMSDLVQELLITIRGLVRRPSFTIVVLLTLMVGIAASTAIFTVLDSVLLRPLPFRSPERLAMVPSVNQDATGKEQDYGSSLSDFLDWRERNHSFEALVAMQSSEVAVTGKGEPEQVDAGFVSANLFDALGIQLHAGRAFREEEEIPNSPVVIITKGLWRSRYGGEQDVLGKTIVVDGVARKIVGLGPDNLLYAGPARLWLPLDLSFDRSQRTPQRNTAIAGRLRSGVSFEQASDDMKAIAAQMSREFPINVGWSARVRPIREPYVQDIKPMLIFLSGAVVFLLIILCINVANLVLIRHIERCGENVLRLMLGAERWDLWKRTFLENICLTLLAGALGLLVARFALPPLIEFSPILGTSPSGNKILESLTLDPRVILFAFVLSLLIAILLSILPLFKLPFSNLSSALKSGSKGTTGMLNERRFQNIFVVAQLSISFMLLVSAVLTIQTFHGYQGIDTGFRTASLLTASVTLPATRYDTHEKRVAVQRQMVESIRSIPGVVSASATTRLPLNEFGLTALFDVDGIPPVESGFTANFRRIGEGYFETMKVLVLEGRDFTSADLQDGLPVAIVSQQMARRFWPGQSAIGKRIRRRSKIDNVWRTVVGVVGDMKDTSLTVDRELTLYVPFMQSSVPSFHLVLRTAGRPEKTVAMLREQIRQIDPDLPLYKIATGEELFADSLSRPRFAAYLLVIFALVGAFVALVGVYGVVSYSTSRRVNEIGIRMAIGADLRSILQLIFEQSIRYSLWGILFGFMAALIMERMVTTVWATPGTVLLYVTISGTVLLSGLIASLMPALRAIRIDPVTALRHE